MHWVCFEDQQWLQQEQIQCTDWSGNLLIVSRGMVTWNVEILVLLLAFPHALDLYSMRKEEWVPQTCVLCPCSQAFLDQWTSYVSNHLTSQPALEQLSDPQMAMTIVQILLPLVTDFATSLWFGFVVVLEGNNLASLHRGDRIYCRWSSSLISLCSSRSFWSAPPSP